MSLYFERKMSLSGSISQRDAEAFSRDGAVLLRNVFTEDEVEDLRRGVEANMTNPGPMSTDYTDKNKVGRYFGDYCNWERIDGYKRVALSQKMGELTATLMGGNSCMSSQFFHEHVLVKEPNTTEYTPWHQDQPYYIINGSQTVSLWVPLDPVAVEVCPRFVAESNHWPGLYRPRKFLDGADYPGSDQFTPVPDIDADQLIENEEQRQYKLLSWSLQPGDCIAFDFKTMHNAPPNLSNERRRVVSLRYFGGDCTYAERPHNPSPPYPDLMLARAEAVGEKDAYVPLSNGDKLPQAWFPMVYSASVRGQS